MEKTPFVPHGGTSVELRGRTVILRSSGDLNREEIQRVLGELGKVLPQLAGKRWGFHSIATQVVMMTSEAEKAAIASMPQLAATGLAGFAVTILVGPGRPMMEAQITRTIGSVVPLAFFGDEAAGQAWLDGVIGS